MYPFYLWCFCHSQMIAQWWRSKSQKNWEVWRVALTLSSLCLLETVPLLKTHIQLINFEIAEASSSSALKLLRNHHHQWWNFWGIIIISVRKSVVPPIIKADYGELIWAWQIPLRRNARPVEVCLEYRGSVVGTEAVWPGSHHLGLHASTQPSLYRLYGMSRNPQERTKLIFTCLCGRALSRATDNIFRSFPLQRSLLPGAKGGRVRYFVAYFSI